MLLERYPAPVLAAATERSVCYWSGDNGGGYGDAARLWQIPETDLRKAGAHLQRLLKPTGTSRTRKGPVNGYGP